MRNVAREMITIAITIHSPRINIVTSPRTLEAISSGWVILFSVKTKEPKMIEWEKMSPFQTGK